jgi:outer membrane receptor protein involved in Fe transport
VSNYYSLRNRENSTTTASRGESVAVMFDMNTDEDNNLWDYSLKLDNEFKINGQNKLEFGINYSNYKIDYRYAGNDSLPILNMQNKGNLLSAYVQDRWTLDGRFTVLPGIRLSYYDVTARPYAEPRKQLDPPRSRGKLRNQRLPLRCGGLL